MTAGVGREKPQHESDCAGIPETVTCPLGALASAWQDRQTDSTEQSVILLGYGDNAAQQLDWGRTTQRWKALVASAEGTNAAVPALQEGTTKPFSAVSLFKQHCKPVATS